MDNFLLNLPKIELHAHLNGSLSIASIQELGELLYGKNTSEFIQLCEQFIDLAGLSLDDCFKKFKFMHDLTSTKRGLLLATQLIIRDFANDNVVHLELRTTPKSNAFMSKREYLSCVLEGIEQAMHMHDDIRVKLLVSVDRTQTVECAADTLSLLLLVQSEYPHIVAGLDFCGNPASGDFKDFVPVLSKARRHGIKLALHCAEIDNSDEIEQMLQLGMERCGHGTFLSEQQILTLAQHKIPIECCLTSNIKCGTVETYPQHHFRQILDAGHPVVICTDDCGVFDTTLSRELQIAAKVFDLKKKDIYSISMHAIESTFATEEEKTVLEVKILTYFNNTHYDDNN